jgi:hypothetical protein
MLFPLPSREAYCPLAWEDAPKGREKGKAAQVEPAFPQLPLHPAFDIFPAQKHPIKNILFSNAICDYIHFM